MKSEYIFIFSILPDRMEEDDLVGILVNIDEKPPQQNKVGHAVVVY